MKPTFLLLTLLVSLASRAQYTYVIKADSVKLTGASCDSSELILQNHTQGIPGFLFNTGNGRTQFRHGLQMINDTLYLIGADTLNLRAGGSCPFDTVTTIQQLEGYSRNPDVNTVLVTDTARGGLFSLQRGSFVADSATIFSAFNRGTNVYWVRVWDVTKGLNALWFGIKRDGTTNNTALLTQAVSVQAKLKTRLLFPKGTYMTNVISLVSNMTLQGTQRDSVILRLNPGTSSNTGVFTGAGTLTGICFSDLTLDANVANQTGTGIYCLQSSPSGTSGYFSGFRFSNVAFINSNAQGSLWLLGGSSNPINDIHVDGCYFANSGSSSLQFRGVNYAYVDNCTFTSWGINNPTSSASVELSSQTCTALKFSGNSFINTISQEFAIESSGAMMKQCIFSGNYFWGNYLGGAGINGYFDDCVFSDNIHEGGFNGQRSGYNIVGNRDKIHHNHMENGSITVIGTGYAANGIENTGDGCIIDDNYIRDSATNLAGIFVGGSNVADTNAARDISIHDNIVDVSASTGNSPGIALGYNGGEGFLSKSNVHDNLIRAGSSACIRFYDGLYTLHDIKVHDNIYYGGNCGIQFDSSNLYNIQIANDNYDSTPVPISYLSRGVYTGKVFVNTPIKDTVVNNMVTSMSSAVGVGVLKGISATPTVSLGTGAGTSPSYTISGNGLSGKITITTGTTPSGSNATIATVTYPSSFPGNSFPSLTPGNAAAAQLAGTTMIYVNGAASGFTVVSGTSGLTASVTYVWYYSVSGQ